MVSDYSISTRRAASLPRSRARRQAWIARHTASANSRGRRGAAQIPGARLARLEHRAEAGHDAVGCGALVDVPEHQHRRQQQRGRVREPLAGDVRRAAVHRLEHADVAAEIGRADHAEAADQPGAQIRDDVAVEVRHHQHVELLRVHHQVHARRVDDLLVVLDVRIARAPPARTLSRNSPSLELHDVGLVNRRDLLAAVPPRVVEGELARCASRRVSVMIFRLSTTPGTTSCSRPA